MKKYLSFFGVFASLIILSVIVYAQTTVNVTDYAQYDGQGNRIQPYMLRSGQFIWESINTCASDGAEPNDPNIVERTYITISARGDSADDKLSLVHVPSSWVGVQFECLGITNNNDITYQIYLGTLGDGTDCTLKWAAQLAFKIGQQASTISGYELADTLTVTQGDWPWTWSSVSPANDRVANGRVYLGGADLMLVVPTAAACDCILGAKGY